MTKQHKQKQPMNYNIQYFSKLTQLAFQMLNMFSWCAKVASTIC